MYSSAILLDASWYVLLKPDLIIAGKTPTPGPTAYFRPTIPCSIDIFALAPNCARPESTHGATLKGTLLETNGFQGFSFNQLSIAAFHDAIKLRTSSLT